MKCSLGRTAQGGAAPLKGRSAQTNYEGVRRFYFRTCLMAAILVCIMENAMFAVFYADPVPYGGFKTSIQVYLLNYNVIPSAINFLTVGAAWLVGKRERREDVLNFTLVAAMAVICSVTAAAHSIYPITMSLLYLPIFMASVYGKKEMVYATSGLCAVGLSVAVTFRFFSPYQEEDPGLVPEAVAAAIILLVVAVVARALAGLLNGQREQLIATTREAETARQQAQSANQAKSDFLANMSHEIRTPLNAVVGLTEMISRESKEPEIQSYAGDIQQAGNHLLSVINDILDISKIESGNVEVLESRYELGSLINDSYNMVAVRLQEKHLTATVSCDPDLPRLLYGDEYHLRQILVNLLSNAVKYTRKGGLELKVTGEENGEVLRLDLRVKDTGIGIRQEDMEDLFGQFNRLELGKNRHIEGSGLGLSITKQLVELLHGTITVESTYGVGSTFTVRVPQKIADRTPVGDIRTTYLNMHGEAAQWQHSFEAPEAWILAVDDVPINLRVIRKLLGDTGIQVDTAESGRETLEKVCQRRYDLILMDHMMPEMDGVETLEAMNRLPNSKNRGVPVIMLTANAMHGAREEYLDLGFVDYLDKPVRGARLEGVILKYLPAEKVKRTGEAVPPEDKGPAQEAPPAETHPEEGGEVARPSYQELLPELDAPVGISYCGGDEDFYRSMLAEFAAGERDKKLEQAYRKEDWYLYRIEAHSLKSAARMVGLEALSEESLKLEEAAKEGDLAYIYAHHEEVAGHYRTVAEALKRA